ncbi:MAG: hypothetical protein LBT30_03850 [Clostridiales bacterium]|jgi:hypothetical protein|nr:hypothetical protein [Clostridiales bacterium]
MTRAVKKKKSLFKKLLTCLSVFIGIFIAACLVFMLPAMYIAGNGTAADIAEQKARVAALRDNPSAPVDEQSFASFDLASTDPKINAIQTLNTHNSYRKMLTPYMYAYFKTFYPQSKQAEFLYEHATFTEQLNDGVRGLEWDIRAQNGVFSIYHFTVFDYGSTAPDLTLALEEIKIWSDNNPGHVPVTILVEYKPEPWILNFKREKQGIEPLKRLNEAILQGLGADKLITPSDIIGGYGDMKEAVTADNWPRLSEAKGKFMFLLHYNAELTPIYISIDQSMKTLSMFPTVEIDGSYKLFEKYEKYVSHILFNNPIKAEINALVSAGYIVRTRADADMYIIPERRAEALSSGAQLLTTDYVKGRHMPDNGYFVLFDDLYTIKLNFLG